MQAPFITARTLFLKTNTEGDDMFYLQEKTKEMLFKRRYLLEKDATQLRAIDDRDDHLQIVKRKLDYLVSEIKGIDSILAKTVSNEEFNKALGQNLF